MEIISLPQEVRACLWSYDTNRIDLSNTDHRQRIIENVLNHGTKSAVDWLLGHFSEKEIADTIVHSTVSSWNKKSLALWSLIFGVLPSRTTRFS